MWPSSYSLLLSTRKQQDFLPHLWGCDRRCMSASVPLGGRASPCHFCCVRPFCAPANCELSAYSLLHKNSHGTCETPQIYKCDNIARPLNYRYCNQFPKSNRHNNCSSNVRNTAGSSFVSAWTFTFKLIATARLLNIMLNAKVLTVTVTCPHLPTIVPLCPQTCDPNLSSVAT